MPNSTRRGFLKTAGLAGAALATSLWLPRRARGGSAAPIKRVVIVHATGAVRWTASFDGQTDVTHNPWGILPWSLVGRGAAPKWGFSRMLVQRPLLMNAADWAGVIYPYLSSNDPAHFNVNQATLTSPGWNSALLPTYADIAGDVAVVRLTGNPGAQFDGDHASASHTLFTGYRSGQIGLGTVLNRALKDQLGSAFDTLYPLPAVAVGQAAWSFGVGDYAAYRPIFLTAPTGLPTTDPGQSVAAWGRKAEQDLDTAFAASRQSFMNQAVADFINDKAAGDAHVKQLIDPSLHLYTTPAAGAAPATLGTLSDGTTPVSNAMINEVFGVSSDLTPAGDILFDAFGAAQSTTMPTWTASTNPFGLSGALAVRLLQIGAPIVSITVGSFDTHSYEVIDPQAKHPQTVQVVQLARILTGLNFALKHIADPQDPTKTLWDSTVVITCSEFGRGGGNIGPNGFNSPSGQNDGGSDHDPFCGWPIFGGPVVAGGALLTDTANGGFFHQNRVFTTVLKGLGIDDAHNPYLPYGTFAPITGLIAGI